MGHKGAIRLLVLLILLIIATYTDIRWRIIPNYIAVMIVLLAGYNHFLNGTWQMGLIGLGLMLILFIPYLLGQIGGGDVKLLLALGFYLGIGIILISFIVLIILALFVIYKGLQGVKNTHVPLAPFILSSYLILGGVALATKVL